MGGVWFVEFPLDQYNEDVYAIANEKGLTVIDAKNQLTNHQLINAPVLTKKEKSPKK